MIVPLHAGEVRWFMPGTLRASDVVRCAGHDVRLPTLSDGGRDFAWGDGMKLSFSESNGAVEVACDAAAQSPPFVGMPSRDTIGPNGLALIRGANRLSVLTRLYGKPTYAQPGAGNCVVAWKGIGLRVIFRGSSCAQRSVLVSATVSGSDSWHSLSGVKIGDPLAKLIFEVRGAKRIGTRTWRIGSGSQYRSMLVATIGAAGTVSSFTATLENPPR